MHVLVLLVLYCSFYYPCWTRSARYGIALHCRLCNTFAFDLHVNISRIAEFDDLVVKGEVGKTCYTVTTYNYNHNITNLKAIKVIFNAIYL